jgi:hydrogenase maturation protein HypF
VKPARLRIGLTGAVQGVGFRPFVYKLAVELDLSGWVLNSGSGLEIDVEGEETAVRRFLERLDAEKPRPAVILTREVGHLAPAGHEGFVIRESADPGDRSAGILPDLATCPECIEELFDTTNRRFQYPFTNCTLCGPRYTIVRDIPYDRPNTTMCAFEFCPDCRREYTDPADRRFHAQPNACPVCGPQLSIEIDEAADALRAGRILALKGIGGFQLLVDARNPEAVRRLRERKRREEKPFAVMMPSLDMVRCLPGRSGSPAIGCRADCFARTSRRRGGRPECLSEFAVPRRDAAVLPAPPPSTASLSPPGCRH